MSFQIDSAIGRLEAEAVRLQPGNLPVSVKLGEKAMVYVADSMPTGKMRRIATDIATDVVGTPAQAATAG